MRDKIIKLFYCSIVSLLPGATFRFVIDCLNHQKMYRPKPVESGAGFTLVELLMYMGLFVVLIGIVTTIFTSTVESKLESESSSSIQQDGEYLLAKFAYDLKRARQIVNPINPGQTANSLQLDIDGTNFSYSQNNGNVEITDGVSIDVLNSARTKITALQFTRISYVLKKPTAQINFTLSSKTQRTSGFETKNFTTTVSLR